MPRCGRSPPRNVCSSSAMTARRSGVAQCSRSRTIVRPNRPRSSSRFTRSPLSCPLRSRAGPPAPIRISHSTNCDTPAAVKNSSGSTSRPKNMSSFEYRKCSASPGIRCSCASTACELWVGSTDGSAKNSSLRTMVILGWSAQPGRNRRVGGDEDPPHPRRIHVDAAKCVAELIDMAVAGGSLVAFAHHVLGHLGRALALEVARRAVHP